MGLTLDLDLKKCTACGACAVACMDQNDIDTEKGIRPFRTVFDWERSETAAGSSRGPGAAGCDPACAPSKYIHVSIACMHCTDAPCVTACPCACIRKDEETNLTIYDNTGCIGCHSCAMACPFGIPAFNEEGHMQKCDGCAVRVRHGLEPACVRVCPSGALRLVHTDELEQTDISNSLIKWGEMLDS